MSSENNEAGNATPPSAPGEKGEAGTATAGMMQNLKSNPKVLYVAGGAAVVVALLLALGGGGGGAPVKTIATLSAGQSVTLANPNGGETQLNALPSLVSVAQTEEDEKQIVCRVAYGTQASVVEEQSTGALSFVKVQVKDGPCQGNSGWTAKINLK